MAARPPVHRITLRAYVHPTEDLDLVGMCMAYIRGTPVLPGGEVDPYLATIRITDSETYYGARLVLMEDVFDERDGIVSFLSSVVSSNGLYFIESILEERTDEECCLHLRFDKDNIMRALRTTSPGAINSEGFRVVEGENIVKAVVKLAANPARKEVAVRLFRGYLEREFGEGGADGESA